MVAKLFYRSLTVSAFSFVSFAALAGEAEFGITAEFMKVCSGAPSLVEQAEASFVGAGWEKASSDIEDALEPDDFLKKIKGTKAFSVELDNGATWMGAVSSGKLDKNKVIYCSITAIDDDPNGYRQDFELASGLNPVRTVTPNLERRDVYESDSDGSLYVMREIRSPEVSYFTYIKVSPQAKKGK